MLGSLAKWLRILGYDTAYYPDLDDRQLVRLARAEDRVLLTRDRELSRRRGVKALLVTSEELDQQLGEVFTRLKLVPDRAFSRCPVCNEPLQGLAAEEARRRVPPYVAQTQQAFRLCPKCQRIYWRGTHWQHMEEYLARLGLEDAESS